MQAVINLPPEIRFGYGSLDTLAVCLEKYEGKHIFVVTDRGIVENGLLGAISKQLSEAGIDFTVYSEVKPNPGFRDCIAGVNAYHETGSDLIVAVGGGSVIDAAKGIQLFSSHPHELSQYDVLRGGVDLIRRNMPVLVAIPTTSGTGSEASSGAVITDDNTNQKVVVVSPFLVPAVAIVDPEMSINLPGRLTAETGVDALTHCIEVYLSQNEEPLTDAMMLYGIELCCRYLERVVTGGSDREARKWMAFAATIGGIGINNKGLGASHSLSHQLSTDHHISHGLANAIMLPYVMEFNLNYARSKYETMARLFNPARGGNCTAEDAVKAVRDLISALEMPLNLSGYGISERSVDTMSLKAMDDPCQMNNPRPCSVETMKMIYRKAIIGEWYVE